MDLIYTNKARVDDGVLKKYKLDYEMNVDAKSNTFDIETILDKYLLNTVGYIYAENSEIGGIVDSRKVDTERKIMHLSGRTWRGLLASKVICPDDGEAYLTVTGTISDVIAEMLERCDVTDLFVASTTLLTDITYKFNRYTDLYSGLSAMLNSVGMRLTTIYKDGTCEISAVQITDYTGLEELTSDLFAFTLESTEHTANHMIGLGSGQLEERLVVHKYIQEDGSVGDEQYYFGTDEVTEIYENTNIENIEDLEQETIEALKKSAISDGIKIKSNNLNAELYDKFSAYDIVTNLRATQYVTRKIVVISNDKATMTYEVGKV